MSQCPTSSQMSHTHLRSQCCQILCMHQCAIHECVGAQMFWNTLRHRLFHHLLSSQNVPAATPSWSPPLPVTRETPSVQQPVTPHVDVQPEFPPPASSADDDPMPFPHVEDTPPWVYQEPQTLLISTEHDTPVTIHSTASAFATQTSFFVTGGDEHVHW